MNKKLLNIAIFGVLLVAIAALVMPFLQKEEVVYVDTTLLYDNFQGKIELEKEFSAFVSKQTNILDSIEAEVKSLYDEYQIKPSKDLESKILIREKNYDRLNSEFSKISQEQRSKYMDELWKQINGYVKTYGDESDYKVILGANGTGSLMYSKKEIDITTELTAYINSKYAGE